MNNITKVWLQQIVTLITIYKRGEKLDLTIAEFGIRNRRFSSQK